MQHLFLADLHLGEQTPEILKHFQRFMQYCHDNVEHISAVYILGDFFEVWIGDDYVDNENCSEAVAIIFSQLRWLSEQSIKTYFMHGNRDFLIGKQFEKITGFQLLDDPYFLKLDNIRLLLSHGDILCTDDQEYQQLRSMFRDPNWQQNFLSKSIPERYQMALEARKQSQDNYKQRTRHSGQGEYIDDVNQQAVEQIMSEHQADVLIHGHTHRPDTHTFKIDNKKLERRVLSAWYSSGSFLKYENGQFETINL